ncbi:MAG: hypothetical protein J5685_11385, partial [Clostridiales bacterium]|nr:hypothetical protein [Clostridiales bacterium]
MKLIELKCPYCEGSVKLDVDEELKSYYCLHCGKKIVDEETVNALYKEIYADEPSAVDTKEDIQALELERCCFNMPI